VLITKVVHGAFWPARGKSNVVLALCNAPAHLQPKQLESLYKAYGSSVFVHLCQLDLIGYRGLSRFIEARGDISRA